MIIYGKNVIREAVLNKRPIYKMHVDEKSTDTKFINFLEQNNVKFVKTNKGELNNLTNNGVHNGVVADVKPYEYVSLESALDESKVQKFLMLDEIQDPHNLGAILRSVEATKFDGVIVSKSNQVELTGAVAKTSSGAIEHVKMILVSNLYQTILKMQEKGFIAIGTAGEAKHSYTEIPKDKPLVIIMGNEAEGLRPLIKKGCDMLVSIPMFGKVNSLNVSVATALMLYQTI
ncbi:23S rRNA (guanosine(2251)-2'-O)-methyltransferase RlmB [Acholeplasma hippikon]|uniref:TrmH family RNA methyltransferase n=1 Tax=Acholeplasma hippikon TaxID=264636 RepID=A0A449BKC6_9MOLU|nr:23S rRNA (guanosine(2251)-2'-O)-methyltransferase RlmB [Acholeplasma hippikon]VEU82925.1 TrmH family RNA methyltransferase [Acholeplasma hippikon]